MSLQDFPGKYRKFSFSRCKRCLQHSILGTEITWERRAERLPSTAVFARHGRVTMSFQRRIFSFRSWICPTCRVGLVRPMCCRIYMPRVSSTLTLCSCCWRPVETCQRTSVPFARRNSNGEGHSRCVHRSRDIRYGGIDGSQSVAHYWRCRNLGCGRRRVYSVGWSKSGRCSGIDQTNWNSNRRQ